MYSYIVTCADPGVFLRGGGPGHSDKITSDNIFLLFLVLSLFYRSQMVKRKLSFVKVAKGVQHIPGRGGPTFYRGGVH